MRAKIMSLTIGMQYLANFCLTRFFPNMVSRGVDAISDAEILTLTPFSGRKYRVLWPIRDLCCRVRCYSHLRILCSSR
jgi:hypothetical protein